MFLHFSHPENNMYHLDILAYTKIEYYVFTPCFTKNWKWSNYKRTHKCFQIGILYMLQVSLFYSIVNKHPHNAKITKHKFHLLLLILLQWNPYKLTNLNVYCPKKCLSLYKQLYLNATCCSQDEKDGITFFFKFSSLNPHTGDDDVMTNSSCTKWRESG